MAVAVNTRAQQNRHFTNVSLGPNGEWWVLWDDDSWCYGTCSVECEDDLMRLQEDGRAVRQVLFGPCETFFIRFS
jgi:hypothetical protein